MTAVGVAQRAATRPISCVATKAGTSATSSITLQQPAGVQENDFGLLLFRGGGTFNPPADWATIYNGVYWKFYGASDGAISMNTTTSKVAAALAVFRGVDLLYPVDEVSTKANAAGTTATTTPLTATVNGTIVNVLISSGTTGASTVTEVDPGQRVATAAYFDRRGAIGYGPPIHSDEISRVATWTAVSSFTGATTVQFVLRRARSE